MPTTAAIPADHTMSASADETGLAARMASW